MGHAEFTLHDQPAARRISLDEYWMPFTPNRDFKHDPRMVVRAEGMYFWNDRGDRILDGAAGLFCVAAGHGRREIADAVGRQLLELDFVAPFTRGHPKQFEFATRVAELTPGDLNRIFFTNSGSEAVDTAMKIALAYHQARGQSGRTMFVSRERAYHGVNFGGVSLAGMVNNRRRFGPTLPGIAHMRHTHVPENRFTPGEGAHGAELADDLLRFVNLYGAENIAACIVEPIAGSTGCLVPPKGYLQRLRAICDQHGILLVFDEVITGVGRTGPELRRAELRRDARPHDDGEGADQRRAADGRGRRVRAHPRRDHGRGARGRDRVLPRLHVFRDIRRRARRGSPRSTSTATKACSSAAARCRRVSSTRSSRSGMRRTSPTCAATACSRRSTSSRRAPRAPAATSCRSGSSTTACTSRPPATA